MLNPLALVKAGLGAASGTYQAELRWVELERSLPLQIAHFRRLQQRLVLPDDDPLLRTAERIVAEASEACALYKQERETTGVVKAVRAAQDFAGGYVGLQSWEERFASLIQRLQALIVASLTLSETGSTTLDTSFSRYIAHCFAHAVVNAEVPPPPVPEGGEVPGFVRADHEGLCSGRIDIEWRRPSAPSASIVPLARPARYQLWCERSFDALQGSINHLKKLGVQQRTLEPSVIGLAHHVYEVNDDSEVVRVGLDGGVQGLAAGTEYSVAVRTWLDPPAGCEVAWSHWSDWARVGTTSATAGVPTGLRCEVSTEKSLLLRWARPSTAQLRAGWEPPASSPVPRSRCRQIAGNSALQTGITAGMEELPELDNIQAGIGLMYEYEIEVKPTGVAAGGLGSLAGLRRRATAIAATVATHLGVVDAEVSGTSAVHDDNHHVDGGQGINCEPHDLAPSAPESTRKTAAYGTPPMSNDATLADRTREIEALLEAAGETGISGESDLMGLLPVEENRSQRAVLRWRVTSSEPSVTFQVDDGQLNRNNSCDGVVESPAVSSSSTSSYHHSDAPVVTETEPQPEAPPMDIPCPNTGSGPTPPSPASETTARVQILPGSTFRVSVRARPVLDKSAGQSLTSRVTMALKEGQWGGWCKAVDMQTASATDNPPPTLISPMIDETVVLGKPVKISWSGPHIVLGAQICNSTGLSSRELDGVSSAEGNCSGQLTWDGYLWGGQSMRNIYSQYGVAPSPMTIYLYLRYRGPDGAELFSPARLLQVIVPPLLSFKLKNSSDTISADQQERSPAVYSQTVGEPIDISWTCVIGVHVERLELQPVSNFADSMIAVGQWLMGDEVPQPMEICGAVCGPVPTLKACSSDQNTCKGRLLWNGKVGGQASKAAAAAAHWQEEAVQAARDAMVWPPHGNYQLVAHIIAPASCGGLRHTVSTSLQLDEGFEHVVWDPETTRECVESVEREPQAMDGLPDGVNHDMQFVTQCK